MTFHCRWDGENFIPLPRHHNELNVRFERGETVTLDEVKARSGASHNHYFAAVHDAWANLPDDVAEMFPSDDHLRKWCLIRSGYCVTRVVVLSSAEEALKFVGIVNELDEFAVAIPTGNVVSVSRAKSQKLKEMGKADFQASKDAVFHELSKILGTTVGEIKREAGRAA